MSNEELVAAIQTGQTELIPQLWNNVEKLISWRANRFLAALSASNQCHGIEVGDLINSSYFAVLAAINSYDSEKSLFSTWLLKYLKSVFAEVCGYRTERQRRDPLRYAVSIDTPLGDADSDTIGDLFADPSAEMMFQNTEEAVFREQLHRALDDTISKLPDLQATVIRSHYWEQQTLEEIGVALGKSTERIRQLEQKAIRTMRMPLLCNQLDDFVERHTPYYLHVGPQEYQRTRTSAPEKIVLLRERLRNERKMQYDNKRMVRTLPHPNGNI